MRISQWEIEEAKVLDFKKTDNLPHLDHDSLRMRFHKPENKKIPTGDPSYPPYVRKAKSIAR